MKTQQIAVSKLVLNTSNPRTIKDAAFQRLVQSVKDFPQMLDIRPIVVTPDMVVIAGNMRLRACMELGMDKVPVVVADKLTPAQVQEFIIKDNLPFGEWDWDALANEWDTEQLVGWGLDFTPFTGFDLSAAAADQGENPYAATDEQGENPYTAIVEPVHYTPLDTDVEVGATYDTTKADALTAAIDADAALPTDVKAFLRRAAQRHVVFNYSSVADYYAAAPEAIRAHMRASALVLIDLDDAIKNGYVRMTEGLRALVGEQEQAEEETA